MIRYLLIFLFLKSLLFGCSLCSIYSPKTHVSTQIKADKEYIKTLKVTWSFPSEFTKELLKIYDLNLDATFDEKELKLIEDALLDYLKPKNFLTTISYDNKINEKSLPFEVKNYRLNLKDYALSFEYNIDLNYKIYDKNILYIKIVDKEEYFSIIFEDIKQLLYIPYKVSKQTNINEVIFTIDAPNLKVQEDKKEEIIQENKEVIKEEKIVEKQKEEQLVKEENLLEKFNQTIKEYLVKIQKGEDKFALIFLLMASFIYGIIHSLGPGHGKALAFSYFSSFKSSYFEAFLISLGTAFVHIIGAFVLVMFSVFVLQSVMNRFMQDSILYITNFSALIIMFLALYILYRKLTKKSNSCSCCISLNQARFDIKPNKNLNFVKTAQQSPILIKPRSKKQDLLFVLSAGIIPCPGTVLLFVYAFLLETYFAVILASVSISLGMAVVIFASSFLGVSIHKVSQKSKKLVNILEIVSPIFMFILALLLFFSITI